MKIKRSHLFSAVYGSFIGSNMPYEINELMFWLIAIPSIVLGIILYFKAEK